MADAYSTFSSRLNEAFELRKIDESSKIQFITTTTGRTLKTARRWLSAATTPRYDMDAYCLARALEIDFFWLYTGRGLSPREYQLAKILSRLPPELLPKVMRLCIRRLNHDPKERRWMAMFERGELSYLQVLAMA